MQKIFAVLIFCIILLLYLHIYYHTKVSNDLEVYELDNITKEKLENICDLRQPSIFTWEEFENYNVKKSEIMNNFHEFSIKIRNTNELNKDNMCLPLPINESNKLFDEDKSSSYFTEYNSDFLIESNLIQRFQANDSFLRPYMISNQYYDIMYGSNNSSTPLKYELNYRNYILVTEGSITIRLLPPNNTKYLYLNKDYELFEFRSPINPWNVQSSYIENFKKCKYLDVTLQENQIIYIPSYWWYSIRFNNNSFINTFKYRTYMNNIAISHHIILSYLQLQNIKNVIAKKYTSSSSHSSSSDNKLSNLEKKDNNNDDKTNISNNISDDNNNK